MKKILLLLGALSCSQTVGTASSAANDATAQTLEDTRSFYLEPSHIYHASFKRALYGFENGWAQTYDFYENGQECDENDALRRTYARFFSVTAKAHNIRFGDYEQTIEIFEEFESIIDSLIEKMGDTNHPLLGFIYLQYMVFINKCTVSSNVSLLCTSIDNVICFIESKWKTQDNEPTDAIAYLQSEAFKVRGMLYSHSANALLKNMQGVGAEERARLGNRRTEDIKLSEQSLREAENRAQDLRQKEIIQKHWDMLEEQRRRTEQRSFGTRTTDYVARLNTYLGEKASYIHKLDERLVQTSYFPVPQTQIPWYKPIVNFQEIEHHPPVFQQQANAFQQQDNHQCMCLDCVMIRSELDRCTNLAFSEIRSDDHFNFVVANLVTAMHLLRDYQAYIDSEGSALLLEIVNKVLSWQEWLSPDVIRIFSSIQHHLGEES